MLPVAMFDPLSYSRSAGQLSKYRIYSLKRSSLLLGQIFCMIGRLLPLTRMPTKAAFEIVEAYVAFSALCQAFHVFKPAAPPPLSNLVAISHSTPQKSYGTLTIECQKHF